MVGENMTSLDPKGVDLDKLIPSVLACIGITIIECYAIKSGLNGVALATSIATLAGLGGFTLGTLRKRKNKWDTKPK